MNGFLLAERVATAINAGTLSLTPNATAKVDPYRNPEEFTANGAVITTVVWRGRRWDQVSKTTRVRVHTIDVAMQRRIETANHAVDPTAFKALAEFAEEVEEHLIATAVSGATRGKTFVGTDVPYIHAHARDHGIGTVVVSIEYEDRSN